MLGASLAHFRTVDTSTILILAVAAVLASLLVASVVVFAAGSIDPSPQGPMLAPFRWIPAGALSQTA